MRIIQTFWTADFDPLNYSFGWLRPEHNLMSWALSCLSIREHYDEVVLYTDERGKHILIDLLHLPYSEVNVAYDKNLCLPQHWAYAKIKTYSVQTKPFIHIDADIYLPCPISEEIIDADLITQNEEKGTEYYRQMMNSLIQESNLIELPLYMRNNFIQDDSLASHNMGLFGGNNLTYIQAYCEEAINLYNTNRTTCSNGNFNLLFEQILFAYKAKKEKWSVKTIFPHVYKDNGYTANEFCQLDDYEHKRCFHLLGGHKRNRNLTASLEEILITRYPDYYKRIVELFPHIIQRGVGNNIICIPTMNDNLPIQSYIDFLNMTELEWSKLSWEDLFEVEKGRLNGKMLSLEENRLKADILIYRNPYLRCFDVPVSWNETELQTIRKRLLANADVPVERIAIIPTLTSERRKEYILHELESQIIGLLGKQPMRISDVLNRLTSSSEEMRTLWINEIRILLHEGLLTTTTNTIH